MTLAPRRLAVLVALATGAAVGVPGAAAAPAPAAIRAAEAPGEWWWSAMGVDELHEAGGTGEGVTVAVVDGPIEKDVPDLRGKVASTSTVCLDPSAPERTRSSTGTGPEAQHATSMAALIAGTGRGTGPGGRGIRGIAPDATIRHYAVLYDGPGDEKTCGVDLADTEDVGEAVARSIVQAVGDGAKVVNLSIVSDYDSSLDEALLTAYRAGAIVVAGTGNGATAVEYPGLGNGVVLVNPVDENARTTNFSVRSHPAIGLAAPGKDVMAGDDDGSGWDSTVVGSGSSIATALVSGGIADVWSAHPDATAGQILNAVKQNVGLRPKTGGSGYETWFRRVGADLPQVTEKNPAYGWGVFAPADAVAVDPTTLPEDNPFVLPVGQSGGPDTDAIAEAMGAAAGGESASATPTPTTSVAPNGGSGEPQAAAPADEQSGSGWVPVALVVLGVLLVLAAAGVLLARRRRTPPAGPGGPAGPTTTAPAEPGPPTDASHTSQGATSAGGRNR